MDTRDRKEKRKGGRDGEINTEREGIKERTVYIQGLAVGFLEAIMWLLSHVTQRM